jgi:hypothetical protein
MSKKFYLIWLTAIIASCNPTDSIKPNSINSTFQPYVDAFLSEARNRNIKIQNGFSVQFGKLEAQKGGVADYSKRVITMDSIVWKNSSEEYHKVAIFHELGHLLLNRQLHNTKILANGEIGSIMYSLDRPTTSDETSFVPTFSGIRQAYYLDELFDHQTKEPDFVQSNYAPFSTKSRKVISRLDFTDASAPLKAYLANLKNCDCVLSKDNLLVQLPKGFGFGMSLADMMQITGLSKQESQAKLLTSNYEIEVAYKVNNGQILFSYNGGSLESSYYFYQNKSPQLYLTTFSPQKRINFLAKPNADTYNTFKITKYGEFFGIYLNDANVFYREAFSLDPAYPLFQIAGSDQNASFALTRFTFSELQ